DFHVTGVQTCALPILVELHPVAFDITRCRQYPFNLAAGNVLNVGYPAVYQQFGTGHHHAVDADLYRQNAVALSKGVRHHLSNSRSEERRVGKEAKSRA